MRYHHHTQESTGSFAVGGNSFVRTSTVSPVNNVGASRSRPISSAKAGADRIKTPAATEVAAVTQLAVVVRLLLSTCRFGAEGVLKATAVLAEDSNISREAQIHKVEVLRVLPRGIEQHSSISVLIADGLNSLLYS